MPTEILEDLGAFRAALERHPRLMLFKHSPICPVSAAAHTEWQGFLAAVPEAEAAFVDVIGARPVARGLAELCGVVHASPQAILFQAGRPVWDASHGAITEASLRAAWES